MEGDKTKEEKMEKDEQTVVKLENLSKSYEKCPIQDISKMEEIVMYFWELLPVVDSEKIKLFYNKLDNETKIRYLERCIKNTKGSAEEIGCRMFNLSQTLDLNKIDWMVSSCDTTIENEKEEIGEEVDVIGGEEGVTSKHTSLFEQQSK